MVKAEIQMLHWDKQQRRNATVYNHNKQEKSSDLSTNQKEELSERDSDEFLFVPV